jgi:hypothetical protein
LFVVPAQFERLRGHGLVLIEGSFRTRHDVLQEPKERIRLDAERPAGAEVRCVELSCLFELRGRREANRFRVVHIDTFTTAGNRLSPKRRLPTIAVKAFY